jgi:hypothetical protein
MVDQNPANNPNSDCQIIWASVGSVVVAELVPKTVEEAVGELRSKGTISHCWRMAANGRRYGHQKCAI